MRAKNLLPSIKSFRVSPRSVLPLLFSSACLLTAGCSEELLTINSESSTLSGTATMFKGTGATFKPASRKIGALSSACTSAEASLLAVNADGSLGETALATSPIGTDGSYAFKGIAKLGLKLDESHTNVSFVVRASGCGSTYFRPVTDYKNQDISGVSTLLTMTSDLDDNSKRTLSSISRHEIEAALDELKDLSAPTMLDLLTQIIADPSKSQKFLDLTNVNPAKLKEIPPATLSVTAPAAIHEGTVNVYSVSFTHWNEDYAPAYEWRLDGAVVAQTDVYNYSTDLNSQGPHTLTLRIGTSLSGTIDPSKQIKTETFTVTVADDYPATPPAFMLVSPSSSGTPIGTRALTLGLNTGANRSHCATFTSLALTEETVTVPATTDFNITCDTAGTQNVAFNLGSADDGPKTLRLWAKDAAGNISAASSSLVIAIDTAPPTVTIVPPLALSNSTSQSIVFSASDNGGTISHYLCQWDAGAFATCSSPVSASTLAPGAHTFTVKAVDTAGNTSAPVSTGWTIDVTPPTLTLTATPDAVTNSLVSVTSFSATDSGGGAVAGFLCRVDNGSFSSCLSPFSQVLGSGSHTIQVKAVDTAGNTSGAQSYSWIIDTVAPTSSFTSHPASLTNATTAVFAFSATDTGGGSVASYRCSLDGATFASCTSPASLSGLTAGAHTYAIKAVDTAGNTGTAVSFNWTIDLTTPMASISSAPDQITNSASASFSFSATPPPSGSISDYECRLDGAAWASCSSPKTYSSLTQGPHSFDVRSIDNNANASAPSSHAWTVDLTNPTVSVGSAPGAINNSTTASFTFSGADTGGGSVVSYQCSLDAATAATCSSPVHYSGLAQGNHSFTVKAVDSAGNLSAAASASWTVDLAAPTVTISSSPGAITNATSASFVFSGADTGGGSVASYQCSLDGAPFSACTSGTSYSALSAGTHEFSVKAVDSADNTGSPQTHNWTVDVIAPTVSITGSPASVANSASATFSFTGIDTGGGSVASYLCSLDGAAFSACVSPKTYSGLPEGARSFAVKAIDTAGNTGGATTVLWAVDTVAPVLTITTPAANGSVVPVSAVTAFAVGGACETGLSISLTGAANTTVPCTGGTWSTSLNLSALSDGPLSLTASQTDAGGNTTAIARTFIKDTTAPVLTFSAVPSTVQKGGTTIAIGFTVTELNITAAQSFTVSSSSDNGSTWAVAGTVTSPAGPLSATTVNFNLALPSANTSQFKVKVSGSDQAGNSAVAAVSNAFPVDSAAPQILSLTVNHGDAIALSSTMTVSVNVTDPLAGVTAVRFADAVGSDCQAAYANSGWKTFTNGGGTQDFSYVTGFTNGAKKICVWAKDAVGNISQITTNSGAGTVGVDTAGITLDQGNPPSFTSISVTNGAGGGTTFATGDPVNLTFTVSDDSALATNPVAIFITTNDITYTPVATYSVVGSPGVGQTSWTSTYSGLTAPGTGYFRYRLVALDANGNTAQSLSPPLNIGKWSVFAGNNDIGDGASALSARLRVSPAFYTKTAAVVNLKNEMFISTIDGIRKVDPVSGNISTYLACGATANGIPGSVGSGTRLPSCSGDLFMDGNDLYIKGSNFLYLADTGANTIKVLVAGGTSASPATVSDLYIWETGGFTVDPATKDIYLVGICTPNGNGATVSVKIQKITQNPTTKTLTGVSDFAGNCVKGSTTNGADALTTPLENNSNIGGGSALAYVPSLNALYFLPFGARPLKIIGGKVYAHATAIDTLGLGMLYNPQDGYIYTARYNQGVYRFAPNATAGFSEDILLYIQSEISCTLSTCRNDGVALGSAGVSPNSLFVMGGQLGIVDGGSVAGGDISRVRVLDAASNGFQTLAGTDRFSGDGGSRTLARFAGLGSLFMKTQSVTGFPAGLYALDVGAGRLLHMDPAGSTISVKAGNGVSTLTSPASRVFGPTGKLGQLNLISNMIESPTGLFTYLLRYHIMNVKTDLTTEAYLAGTSGALAVADGSTSTAPGLTDGEGVHGFVYDGSGNLYFGGYQTTANVAAASGVNRIMVRKSNGSFWTVIGTSANTSSTDCATAGCAAAKSIQSSSANKVGAGGNALGPFDNRHNAGAGRLLFTEGTKIRYVTQPANPAASTFGTLATQSGTPIDMTRTVGPFVYTYVSAMSEQIDKLYYVSTDGKLYCYKVSTGADANCTNAALNPATGVEPLQYYVHSPITMGADGAIYVSNEKNNLIYKYSP